MIQVDIDLSTQVRAQHILTHALTSLNLTTWLIDAFHSNLNYMSASIALYIYSADSVIFSALNMIKILIDP